MRAWRAPSATCSAGGRKQPGTASVRVLPTVGTSIWYGSDRYRNADDRAADTLALAEPDDGSHATAGSGYAHRMCVSTSCIRHMHRHAAGVRNICACTHVYAGVRPEYSQGTARGNSRGADTVGTDAVLMNSVLTSDTTGYSGG